MAEVEILGREVLQPCRDGGVGGEVEGVLFTRGVFPPAAQHDAIVGSDQAIFIAVIES